MKNFCYALLVSVFASATAAFALGGATVTNMDDADYVLILEDSEENTVEKNISAKETLSDLCNDCYVYLKDSEDYEYVGENAVDIMIENGRLYIPEAR